MPTARYVHWQDGEIWIGYFEEFPDYLTQGESIAELEENLRDLYRDITSGEMPGIRKVTELSVDSPMAGNWLRSPGLRKSSSPHTSSEN